MVELRKDIPSFLVPVGCPGGGGGGGGGGGQYGQQEPKD